METIITLFDAKGAHARSIRSFLEREILAEAKNA